MSEHTIKIPLRDGDLTLTQNDNPDEDGFVTLTDAEADMHLTLPVTLLDRLTEVGDIVTIWAAASTDQPADSEQARQPASPEREGQR